MTLDGAINLNETNDFIIYTMNSAVTGQYGVVVPKNIVSTLNMLVDLHMKGSFDGVGNGTKTKEQLITEISDEYNNIKGKYPNGILVMPMIDEVMYQNTVATGDKQKMFDEVKKIGAITSELYKKLTESGIDKQKIDQKIIMVEKNQDDEKFVAWLKEQMPNFVDGVLYSELNVIQEVNPFVASNDLFGAVQSETPKVEDVPVAPVEPVESVAPVEPVAPASNSIFDSAPVTPVEPVAPVASVEPVAPVEPVVASAPTLEVPPVAPSTDIFGTPMSVQEVQNNVAPENNAVTQESVPVAPTPTLAPAVEEPKPVASAPLEGTTTFNPIPAQPEVANPVAESDVPEGEEVKKGSKGFANLAILLVVLIGATLASIELGKFLYSVYGA